MLMFFLVLFALLQTVTTQSAAESLALLVAGIVAPILMQFLKAVVPIEGIAAYIITVVVSVIIAVAALFVTGGFHSWKDILPNGAIVFALTTTVYRLFIKDNKSEG